MNLDDLMIAWFCLLDDVLPGVTENQQLRQLGPRPILAVSRSPHDGGCWDVSGLEPGLSALYLLSAALDGFFPLEWQTHLDRVGY